MMLVMVGKRMSRLSYRSVVGMGSSSQDFAGGVFDFECEFLTDMENESLCNDQWQAGRPAECPQVEKTSTYLA